MEVHENWVPESVPASLFIILSHFEVHLTLTTFSRKKIPPTYKDDLSRWQRPRLPLVMCVGRAEGLWAVQEGQGSNQQALHLRLGGAAEVSAVGANLWCCFGALHHNVNGT